LKRIAERSPSHRPQKDHSFAPPRSDEVEQDRRIVMRSPRRQAVAALIALNLAGLSAPAFAETVPLPRPSPRARLAQAQLAASEPRATPSPGPRLSAPPEPVIPDPRRNVPASIFRTFSNEQRAVAARASTYLTSLNVLSGNFVQIGPDGSRSKGDFYIHKPGRVRFEYDAPSQIVMIADGSSLAVRDRKLATQDIYPLSQTPLRYLLADKIDLMRDTNVVAVTSDDLYSSVTIEERSPIVGTSRMMLMFNQRDGQLKQWTVTDPQGYDTTVAVYNLDNSRRPDASLFKIDFTNYSTGNN
jgi:outer membrane lipoprotein-sorting protein